MTDYSAPGLIISTGNMGQSFEASMDEQQTFLSLDAGWTVCVFFFLFSFLFLRFFFFFFLFSFFSFCFLLFCEGIWWRIILIELLFQWEHLWVDAMATALGNNGALIVFAPLKVLGQRNFFFFFLF